MKVTKENFGRLASGEEVSLFIISNGTMSFSAINYGCCITSIMLPYADGTADDVVLGYSVLDGYISNRPHFGSIVGRCAGRIRNASFSLNGTQYQLTRNSGGVHCLHGGYPFYDKQVWSASSFSTRDEAGVRFFRESKNGEQGFPGNVRFTVSYSLNKDNTIIIRYEGVTDAPTPINLTNHTYFNLNHPGMEADGSYIKALNHWVRIFADRYVEVDNNLIPTGNLLPLDGTPFDFRSGKALSQDFDTLENGYDGTWLLCSDADADVPLAAIVKEPLTGRELHIYSTQPALTMYTANFLDGERGKNGDVYGKHSAVCFETQHVPDSPNHPEFPSVFVYPDDVYRQETRWHFKM